MADSDEDTPDLEPDTAADAGAEPRAKRRWRIAAVLIGILVLGLGGLWLARERLADRIIAGQIESLGVPATYEIESIGPARQVLINVVVGDPAQPDLTIERAVIEIEPALGVPVVSGITLTRPRLYGTYRGGKVSFGSLDKLLFTGSKEKFRFPALDLALVDGRARIDSDYGLIGIKAEGQGSLRDGFAGTLAAIAPQLGMGNCKGSRASLFGTVKIAAERLRFAGPLRLARLDCASQGLALSDARLQLDADFTSALDGMDGKASLSTGTLAWQGRKAQALAGESKFSLSGGALTAQYNLRGTAIHTDEADAASLTLAGALRGRDSFARIESEGTLEAGAVRLGSGLDRLLVQTQDSVRGTFAEPMIETMRGALQREGRNSRMAASFVLRQTGSVTSLVVPRGELRGGSGQILLALSRFDLITGSAAGARVSGNFTTGGAGLPQIIGRIERRPRGGAMARLTMAEYRSEGGRLAIPGLTLIQAPNGGLGFSGSARISGVLPGGAAENLLIPLDGNWSSAGGLAVWRGCVPVQFDRLAYANLTLEKRGITLCPGRDGAILRVNGQGTRFAAGAPALNVSGRLGNTPIRIASGPMGFAIPGSLAAKRLDISLGPIANAASFRIEDLSAKIGKDIAGRFAGTDVKLAAVPLDILGASGSWRYAGGQLTIGEGTFRLLDRQTDARFRPLIARDGRLTLADSQIVANAIMREPTSDREVVQVAIGHDLVSGRGHADLAVAGVEFDQRLQPDTLTRLALGVIANAKGVVRGTGRIDWSPEKTTSTGRFITDGLDFAAAFGPVKGTSGTVIFTDLIGLVTAPDQRLSIASINPGIEVNDGQLSFALKPDGVLDINGANWPFLDGKLTLAPTRMVLGASEVRRYVLTVEGMNAAKFVQRMELSNISASGIFDGKLPLVFDENGGRIEGGFLASRPPGGNVSYVGELSYKNLGTFANFAFEALRSLDYRQMGIALDGSLEGEIVTRLKFDGVKQGAGAKRNFATRQLANLPIQFNVNIRAPFFKLVGAFRSLYDSRYIADPRALGLIGKDGRPIAPAPIAPAQPVAPANPPAPPIQPPVSEKKP
jgi:hypothetical protein